MKIFQNLLLSCALGVLAIQSIYANDNDKALIEAAELGELDKVKSLVAKGANVNARDDRLGATVLMRTAYFLTSLKALFYLESKGVNVYEKNDKGINVQVKEGKDCIDKDLGNEDISHLWHLDVVKYLVSQGADINAMDTYGKTALMYAAQKGQLSIVKYLIAQGADVNHKDSNGATALTDAAQFGNLEVVKYLVSKGANVNDKRDNGQSALMEAVQSKNVELVKYLVSKGANINDKEYSYGKSALMIAYKLEIIQHLIANGANVNDTYSNASGSAVLLNMIYAGESCGRDLEAVKYLISQGADINSKEYNGTTALMLASSNQKLDIIKYLIAQGANVNAKDNDGRSALMWNFIQIPEDDGIGEGDINIIKYLVENGARVNDKDNEGRSALSLATDEKIKSFLRSKGAR